MTSSLETALLCPISLQLFHDPVMAEDGHTYERTAIMEWIRLNGKSPITRQPLSISGLRPNYAIKKVVADFENNIQSKDYKFKMGIDVRRDKRALFQSFGKRIYKADWITQEQRPPVIILQIEGARAQKEASFYVKLSRHSHIVRTYGLVEDVVPSTTSVMLLQEYASEGSLYELLAYQQELPNDKILKEIFIQISDAMTFLTLNQIVHGDLACRNVLVFRFDPNEAKRNYVKLTDFGLSRFSSIYSSAAGVISTTTIHIVPTRTVAPEILENNCQISYTEKSDMYSMGMLMIEAYNKGTIHWSHIANDDAVRTQVLAGNRPSCPTKCPHDLWTTICMCLSQTPAERPTFYDLRDNLTDFTNDPSTEVLATNVSSLTPTLLTRSNRPTHHIHQTYSHNTTKSSSYLHRRTNNTTISTTITDLPPVTPPPTPSVLPPIPRKSNSTSSIPTI
ncbi:unnamed protein product, partial [Rotaria sordida]